ncbi:MAG: HEAT repeat domain-containing protein [Gemmataceae bacterium]
MRSRVLLVLSVSLVVAARPAWADTEKTATLVGRLDDKKKAVRLEALRELGKQGTAAKEAVWRVAALFHHAEAPDEVAQAAATLAQLGPASVPELVKAFKDARVEQARQAALALARMGPAAKKAEPDLIAGLRDRDPVVRAWCAQALGEIGSPSEETVAALFRMVADPAPAARRPAGLALVRAGPKAVPGLRRILQDMSGPDPTEAVTVLGLMGADAAKALPELLTALEDPEPRMRAAAAKALGAMTGKGKEVVPPLVKALGKEKDFTAQQHIFRALTALGEQDVPGFLEDMRRLNRDGNWAAPYVLARFGPRGKDAVKPLIAMLGDPDPGMRLAAVLALGQVGPEAMEAIPHLQLLLRDPQPQMSGAAAQSLWKIDRRLEAAALKQFLFAMDQSDKALRQLEVVLVKSAPRVFVPKLAVDRRAFFDRRIQEPLKRLIDFHLALNTAATNTSLDPGGLARKNRLDPLIQRTADIIDQLGPESIPALVYGVNQGTRFDLGFC